MKPTTKYTYTAVITVVWTVIVLKDFRMNAFYLLGLGFFNVHFLLFVQLASQILSSSLKGRCDPYASNWLERLRQIKRIQSRVMADNRPGEPATAVRGQAAAAGANVAKGPRCNFQMVDFTDYT